MQRMTEEFKEEVRSLFENEGHVYFTINETEKYVVYKRSLDVGDEMPQHTFELQRYNELGNTVVAPKCETVADVIDAIIRDFLGKKYLEGYKYNFDVESIYDSMWWIPAEVYANIIE